MVKITIDIDCTPEEARTFLGLPDVEPMQQRVLAAMEEQMMSNLSMTDPEKLMKTWMPIGQQGLDAMQRFFTQAMSGAASDPSSKSKD